MRISNNLGDAKSLITHPATTTHKNLTDEARTELGIGPGTLRISVGLEDADDLIEDIEIAAQGRPGERPRRQHDPRQRRVQREGGKGVGDAGNHCGSRQKAANTAIVSVASASPVVKNSDFWPRTAVVSLRFSAIAA